MPKIITAFIFTLIFCSASLIAADDNRKLQVYNNDSIYIVSQKINDSIKYVITDTSGKPLTSYYDGVSWLTHGLYFVYQSGKMGVCNTKGVEVLPVIYSPPPYNKGYLVDSYYTINKDNKVGVFDAVDQKVVFPTEYDWVRYDDDYVEPISVIKKNLFGKVNHRMLLAGKKEGGERQVALLDLKSEKIVIPFGKYEGIRYSDYCKMMKVSNGKDWKIIDYDEKLLLPKGEYRDAMISPYGFIVVDTLYKCGFIPFSGEYVSPQYKTITFADNEVAIVIDDKERYGAILSNGKQIIPPCYDYLYIEKDQLLIEQKGKMGIADLEGRVIFKPNKYERIEYDTEYRVAVVQLDHEKVGLASAHGKILVPAKYRAVYFDEGIARITDRSESNMYKMGMYNVLTDKMISPRYDGLERFVNGVSVIGYYSAEGNKMGLIDTNGEELVKPVYETMFFDEKQQYATVSLHGKYGMIGARGNIIIPVEFDEFVEYRTESDKNGIAITCLNKKFGAFNFHQAKELLPAVYDEIIDFRYGPPGLRYLKDGKYGFMDYAGKVIFPPEYDFIGGLSGVFNLIKGGKSGIGIDNGDLLTPLVYDYLFPISPLQYKDDIVACMDGKWGIIDHHGNIVVTFQFDNLKYSYDLKSYIARKNNQVGFLDRQTKQFYTDKQQQTAIETELDKFK